MTEDPEIVTTLTPEFMREFEAEIMGTIPAEKVKADLAQAQIGRVLIKEGSTSIEGLGQRMGEIDARTYFRWLNWKPGCWQDRSFVAEFFADNPQLCDKGYRPKTDPTRHGFTYVDGEPIRVR